MSTDYISGLGKLPDPMGDINRTMMQRMGMEQGQLQNETMRVQLADHQRKAARVAQFETAAAGALKDPTAANISNLMITNPEYADEIKKGWDIRDGAARQTDLTQLGEIYSAGSGGRFDLAAKAARRRYDADLAAGQADDSDLELINALESGDPIQQKAALGMIGVNLAAATGPDHFGSVYGALNKDREGFTLGENQKRFDADGNVIAEGVASQDFLIIPEGGKAIPKSAMGGGGASVPSAPVNIAGAQGTVASTLASANLPAPVIAGFLGNFEVEGGFGGAKGDGGSAHGIAQWRGERQTNFQRIIGKPVSEASHEEQARFVAWEMNNPEAAGMTVDQRDQILAAKTAPQAAALIDKFYERSSGEHRSRRVAAAGRFAGSLGGAASGDPAGTLYGTPKARPARMTPDEVKAEGLDPNVVYYRDANGVPNAVSGQDPRRAKLKPWPGTILAGRAENEASIVNIDNALTLLDPNNKSAEAAAARGSIGLGTGALGDQFTQYNDPQGASFRALIGQVGGVIIKDISGAAVSATEDDRLKKWVPKATDRPEVVTDKLHNLRREIAQRNAVMDETFTEEQGFKPFSRGGGVVKVRSLQEARALPPGTVFTDPKGRRRVR